MIYQNSTHYKKSWFFKRFNLTEVFTLTKRMFKKHEAWKTHGNFGWLFWLKWPFFLQPSLGFMTQVRACKSVGQDKSLGITFHVPRNVWGNKPPHPSELLFWELEFRWTPKSLEGNFKGQNSLYWKFPYTIGNILKRRCLKWAWMTHLGT
jgi:hypothetical protein